MLLRRRLGRKSERKALIHQRFRGGQTDGKVPIFITGLALERSKPQGMDPQLNPFEEGFTSILQYKLKHALLLWVNEYYLCSQHALLDN